MSANNEASDAEAAVIELQLDKQGDVVLIVGTPPSHRITVSSVMLAVISPVFKAMLGPRFAEGQGTRNALEPVEIYLQEDNADAMANICRLLYHEGVIQEDLGLYHLLETMDKYQCVPAFGIQVNTMVTRQIDLGGGWDEAVLNTAIAYLANDAAQFRKQTEILIAECPPKFSLVRDCDGGKALPLNALLVMTEIRQSAKDSIVLEFPKVCEKDNTTPESIMGLRNWRNWLRLDESIAEVLDHLESEPQTTEVRNFRDRIKRECSGLCLKCVKEGLVNITCEKCTKAWHGY